MMCEISRQLETDVSIMMSSTGFVKSCFQSFKLSISPLQLFESKHYRKKKEEKRMLHANTVET